jgi:Cu/Ag efflux pump CusA
MAWAVIGGLVTSTLLTLVVIPSVYMLVGQWELRWFKSRKPGEEE